MALNMQTETFRGFGKLMALSAQTAVECRFGSEVETVLASNAQVTLSGVETGNGEARYFGKVILSVVYEDGEKRVCRAEKGVEFSAKALDERIAPAYTARANLSVDNLAMRKEGASVYFTALIGAEITLFGDVGFEYLTGGDMVCKRETVTLLTAHLCGGEAEAEDEFETEYIGDVLFHAERACVSAVKCETGLVRAEGEINLNILALKGDGVLVSFERLVPFRAEIPCEQAQNGACAQVEARVGNAIVRADADEEKGKCALTVEIALSVEAVVYEELALDGVVDAFARECKLSLVKTQNESFGVGEVCRSTERVSGKAMLSAPVDFSDTLQAITLQRAEADLVRTDEGRKIEGVMVATLLVMGADGCHRGIEMSLPFSIPTQMEGKGAICALACGASARQRQEGEIEAEVTLKLFSQAERRVPYALVSAVEEGEPVCAPDSAISVYIPCVGDGLWELSKRLNKSPEEVTASNPDLRFPIGEGERVVVYRKKK